MPCSRVMAVKRRLARFALVLATLIVAAACSKSEPPAPSSAPPSLPVVPGTTNVIADGKGFSPNAIELKKGESAKLAFLRTTDQTCARDIVFPDLKINQPLPLNEPVVLEIPTGEARTLTFQCGMGMYKSSVVIH